MDPSTENTALLGGELSSLPPPPPENGKARFPFTCKVIVAAVVILLLVAGSVFTSLYFFVFAPKGEAAVDCTSKYPDWNTYPPFPSIQQAGEAIDLATGILTGQILEVTFDLCQAVVWPETGTTYRLPDYVRTVTFDTRVETSFSSSATISASSFSSLEAERISSTVSGGIGLGFSWFGISVNGVHSQSEATLEAHKAYQSQFSYISQVYTEVISATAILNPSGLTLSRSFFNTLRNLPTRSRIPREGRTEQQEADLAQYVLFVKEYGTHVVKKGILGGKYISQFTHQREKMEKSSFTFEYVGECLGAEASVGFRRGVTAAISAKNEECRQKAAVFGTSATFASVATDAKVLLVGGDSGAAASLSVKGADDDAFAAWANSVKSNPSLLSSELWPLSDLFTKQMLDPQQFQQIADRVDLLRENVHVALAEFFDQRNPQVACVDACQEGEVPFQDSQLKCLCEPPYKPAQRRLYSGGHNELLAWMPDSSSSYTNVIPGYASYFDISPDGLWLAVASGSSIFYLNPENFGLLKVISSRASNAEHVTFSRKGDRLAYVSPSSSDIFIHSASSGAYLFSITSYSDVGKVLFSPDGNRLAICDQRYAIIRIWDVSSSFPVYKLGLIGHDGDINDISFSSDGKRLASGGWDKKIRIWNAEVGGSPIYTSTQSGIINALSYSPDDLYLLSGTSDRYVKLLTSSMSLVRTLSVTHPVWSVAFSPDGGFYAAATSDATSRGSEVRIWDAENPSSPKKFVGHSNLAKKVLFDPVRYYGAAF